MMRFIRVLSLFPTIFLLSLFLVTPVLALPPFPSSFYGTVKVHGANVPDGTVVQALIGEQVYAEAYTQTYQGNSVFALDVKGDDTGTTAIDGGREGDTLQFKVGGVPADQTAIWHGGTNVTLDLTITSSKPISKPAATPTSVPTQTEIVLLIQPSLPPSTSVPSEPVNTLIPASPIATEPSRALQVAATHMQISSTQTSPQNDGKDHAGNISPTAVVVIALSLITVIGIYILGFTKKEDVRKSHTDRIQSH